MKAKNDYATKSDLKHLENNLEAGMKNMRSDIVNMKDEIMGELKKVREDNETRITKLESASTASI